VALHVWDRMSGGEMDACSEEGSYSCNGIIAPEDKRKARQMPGFSVTA
jgi:hypothetical protein